LPEQTFVYLKRPQMTAAFSVATVIVDGQTGQMMGDDLGRVLTFLRASDGVPQFDLEYGGRLFSKCFLRAQATSDSIPFSYATSSLLEAAKSDPNTNYL
jgi:hypothetical protein